MNDTIRVSIATTRTMRRGAWQVTRSQSASMQPSARDLGVDRVAERGTNPGTWMRRDGESDLMYRRKRAACEGSR